MVRLRKACGGFLAVLGVILVVVGITLKWAIFPKLVEDQVYENLKLVDGSEGWKAFVEPPVPVYMSFYFFSINNPEEVVKGGRPNVTELGPYFYKETRKKEDLVEVDGDKLYYSTYMDYTFDAEKSWQKGCKNRYNTPCSDQDRMIVLNGALAGAAAAIQGLVIPPEIIDYVETILIVANGLLKTGNFTEEVFKEVSVAELAFDGYETGLLYIITHVDEAVVAAFDLIVPGAFPTIEDVLTFVQGLLDTMPQFEGVDATVEYNKLKLQIDELVASTPQISGGKFGIFKGKNATKIDSYYKINTGLYEKHNYLKLLEFNGKTRLPDEWWPDVAPTPTGQDAGVKGICHEIYGTDGSQFPPFVQKDVRIWIYVAELCRSLWMDFAEETEVLGIPVYRYRPADDVFAMDNPNNYCYCPEFHACQSRMEGKDEWDFSKCKELCKDGMLKVSTCYGGAPIVMTPPHFLQSDPSLIAQIDGVSPPNSFAHETYLDVEPITGAAMAAHKRIQINMPLTKVPGLELMNDVPELIFPIIWADETAELDEENASKFKDLLITPTKVVDGISIGLGMVIGSILFLVGAFLLIKK